MSIELFFSRLDPAAFETDKTAGSKSWRNFADIYTHDFPDLSAAHIAIIGIDYLDGTNGHPANEIRKRLYRLLKNTRELNIADLGNIKHSGEYSETSFALRSSIAYLLQNKVVP